MSVTTSVSELMDLLEARGVRFGLRGGRLAIDAPHGVLTADVRAAIVTHKAVIERLVLTAVGAQPAPRSVRSPRPTQRCHNCRMWRWWQRPDGGWVCGVCHPLRSVESVRQGETLKCLIDNNEPRSQDRADEKCA